MKIVWSHLKVAGLALATSVAISAAGATSAQAADLDPPIFETVEETQVEFGTGWYIRGDIGLNFKGNLFEADKATTIPGTFDQAVETSDEETTFGFGAGFGMRLSPNLRIDGGYEYIGSGISSKSSRTTQYRPPCDPAEVRSVNTTTGVEFINTNHRIDNCIETDTQEFFMQRLSLNAYYDFDTSFFGAKPFVGAGLGVIRNTYTSTIGTLTCTPTDIERCKPNDGSEVPAFGEQFTQEGERDNGTAYHLAPSITAGLSFPVSQNMSIDTSYQYTHMFEDALWGGSSAVNEADFPTQFHAVKVGLRLDIW